MILSAQQLKVKYKDRESLFEKDQAVRIHRAISWLSRAEQDAHDPDVAFILLWIAFNAAYAREFGYEQTERENLKAFLVKVVDSDKNEVIPTMLFNEYSGAIRNLLENKFVYEGFWNAMRNRDQDNQWQQKFESAKRAALQYVFNKDAGNLLSIVIGRLYVLRNQLVHGGATHMSDINRDQVRVGQYLLAQLIPLIIEVLIDRPEFDNGDIIYPVVGV